MPAAAVQPAAVECYNHIFEYEYISIWRRRRGSAPGAGAGAAAQAGRVLARGLFREAAGQRSRRRRHRRPGRPAAGHGVRHRLGRCRRRPACIAPSIAGFTISALGGSRVQIGGPTGAFVVVVSGIVATYGLDGLFMCTLMAGVMLMLLGVTGLGTAVKYIPRPVVIGFTNGIAILIASTQIRDLFGLQTLDAAGRLPRPRRACSRPRPAPRRAPPRCWRWRRSRSSSCCRRVSRRIPGSIIALLAGSALVALIGMPVETIGSRFGGVPGGLPELHAAGLQARTWSSRCCLPR